MPYHPINATYPSDLGYTFSRSSNCAVVISYISKAGLYRHVCLRVLDVSEDVVVEDSLGNSLTLSGATGRGLFKYVRDFLDGDLRVMCKVRALCTDGASAVFRKTADKKDTSISLGSTWLRDGTLNLALHKWCLAHRDSLLLGDCLSKMPR
jgi:hypothetical protein